MNAPSTNAVPAVTLPEGWTSLTMKINKTVPDGKGGNEYLEVGKLVVPVPTLAAFGIDAKIRARTADDGEADEGEESLPLYEDKALDWLYYSAVQAAKAKARNKLVPKTADLKDGQTVAANMEELLKEGDRIGNAAFMKLAAEVKKAFTAWFTGLAKSAAATAMATTLFAKREALALQPEDIKGKMAQYLQQFAETLDPADMERYAKYLMSVEEACGTVIAEDF